MQEKAHEELLSLQGAGWGGGEELQIWTVAVALGGEGKVWEVPILHYWNRVESLTGKQCHSVLRRCSVDALLQHPLLSTYFVFPCSVSFLAVPHPVSKTPWKDFALRHRAGAVLIAPKRCPGRSWLGLHVSSTTTTPKTPNPHAGSRIKC